MISQKSQLIVLFSLQTQFTNLSVRVSRFNDRRIDCCYFLFSRYLSLVELYQKNCSMCVCVSTMHGTSPKGFYEVLSRLSLVDQSQWINKHTNNKYSGVFSADRSGPPPFLFWTRKEKISLAPKRATRHNPAHALQKYRSKESNKTSIARGPTNTMQLMNETQLQIVRSFFAYVIASHRHTCGI